MSNIVDININKEEPYLTGNAICFKCKHRWVSVAPLGVTVVICPECSCDGYLMGTVITNADQWQCPCDCFLFRCDRNSFYCANCGMPVNFNNDNRPFAA